DSTYRIDDDDAVDRGFDDRSPARFAPAQPIFEAHARAEVVDDAGELALALDVRFSDRQVQRKRRPIAPLPGHFATDPADPALSSGEISFDVRVVLAPVRLRHEHADVAAEDFRLAVAEKSLGRRVEGLDAPVPIDEDDGVNGRLDDRSPRPLSGRRVGLRHESASIQTTARGPRRCRQSPQVGEGRTRGRTVFQTTSAWRPPEPAPAPPDAASASRARP